MERAGLPENEARRLEVLKTLGLFETPPEERFDRFARFAQRLFSVPVAYVALVGKDTLWYKAMEGAEMEVSPRDISFCSHTLLTEDIMVVEDTHEDPRFIDSPFVSEPPHIRFYAGVKLNAEDDVCVGTLCIVDVKPRQLSKDDIEILRDLARMVEQEFRAQAMATTDDLTGLSNRRGFRSIAQHAISLCRRMDKPATLMFFDLDGFKAINDNHGHAEGDKVLQDLGKLLLEEFRNSDVIARLGGDEFCVLLTGTDAQQVDKPLTNLRAAIDAQNESLPYEIGYSVGTVAFEQDRHKQIEDLLLEADAAMYREKKSRKGDPTD